MWFGAFHVADEAHSDLNQRGTEHSRGNISNMRLAGVAETHCEGKEAEMWERIGAFPGSFWGPTDSEIGGKQFKKKKKLSPVNL